MAKNPSGSATQRSDSDEHGPRPAERIPPGQYAPDFLRGLQVRNEVHAVREDWDGDPSRLPRGVNWVIYPNGDLERVGFD
jgi:hypothetical protein